MALILRFVMLDSGSPGYAEGNATMADYMELVVREAVCPELAQALVMMYCRFLCQPQACQALRAMLSDEPEVLRQLDALDELHADFPFTHVNRASLDTELANLYGHKV